MLLTHFADGLEHGSNEVLVREDEVLSSQADLTRMTAIHRFYADASLAYPHEPGHPRRSEFRRSRHVWQHGAFVRLLPSG